MHLSRIWRNLGNTYIVSLWTTWSTRDRISITCMPKLVNTICQCVRWPTWRPRWTHTIVVQVWASHLSNRTATNVIVTTALNSTSIMWDVNSSSYKLQENKKCFQSTPILSPAQPVFLSIQSLPSDLITNSLGTPQFYLGQGRLSTKWEISPE